MEKVDWSRKYDSEIKGTVQISNKNITNNNSSLNYYTTQSRDIFSYFKALAVIDTDRQGLAQSGSQWVK